MGDPQVTSVKPLAVVGGNYTLLQPTAGTGRVVYHRGKFHLLLPWRRCFLLKSRMVFPWMTTTKTEKYQPRLTQVGSLVDPWPWRQETYLEDHHRHRHHKGLASSVILRNFLVWTCPRAHWRSSVFYGNTWKDRDNKRPAWLQNVRKLTMLLLP